MFFYLLYCIYCKNCSLKTTFKISKHSNGLITSHFLRVSFSHIGHKLIDYDGWRINSKILLKLIHMCVCCKRCKIRPEKNWFKNVFIHWRFLQP